MEVDEVFLIEGYPEFEYRISVSGNMLYRHPHSAEGWGKVWKFSLEPLNHPEMIIRQGLPLLGAPTGGKETMDDAGKDDGRTDMA